MTTLAAPRDADAGTPGWQRLVAIFVIGFVGLLLEWTLMALARRFEYA